MARTNIPVDILPNYGGGVVLTGVAGDATNDHEVINDGKTLILAENLDVATKAVTIVAVADPYGRTVDTTVTVPAAAAGVPGKAVFGPLDPMLFNQGGGSKVNVDLAAATAVRMYAFKFKT